MSFEPSSNAIRIHFNFGFIASTFSSHGSVNKLTLLILLTKMFHRITKGGQMEQQKYTPKEHHIGTRPTDCCQQFFPLMTNEYVVVTYHTFRFSFL